MVVDGGNGCYADYGWRGGRGASVIYNSAGVEIGWVDPTTVDSVGAYMYNLDPLHARTYRCSPKVEVPPCVPNWKCEIPLNGYASDGCGNRRLSFDCKPSLPPVVPPILPPIEPPIEPPVVPPILPPTKDYTNLIIVVIIIILFIILARK